ncbi:MAG: DUF3656 domain-containing protein [bacterium]|nr:DUF3656 domain-containing protein [bacterium]
MQEQKTVEILAPAGSFDSMKAAIEAGADAVYIGGNRFGARAFANNLDEEQMLEAIDYAHLRGVKLYLTVNTLMKEEELADVYRYLHPFYLQGLDAVIVQDMGAFAAIRRSFPELPIHASTQMTITGVRGARILAELGAERVVTARELSLAEIREIHEQLPELEIESFVHGALCYCYSGQCLMSSLIGQRSGNRGRCAQPCRLPYEVLEGKKVLNAKNEKYVLSPKDLCVLDILPKLLEAGIYSLKIEGRMKSPRYTAGVVRLYRKYVDKYLVEGKQKYTVDAKDRRELLDLFDRGGQTEGYYEKHNGRDMLTLKEKPAFRESNQTLFDFLDQTYVEKQSQLKVKGRLLVKEGEALRLSLQRGEIEVTVEGDIVQQAKNQPLSPERIEAQMRKTGTSLFCWEELEIVVEGRVFLPMQALNQLRRMGMERLEEELLRPWQRKEETALSEEKKGTEAFRGQRENKEKGSLKLYVACEEKEMLAPVLEEEAVSRIYLAADALAPKEWQATVEACHQRKKTCYLLLPQVYRTQTREFLEQNWENVLLADFDGILAGSLEELSYVREKGWEREVVADHNLYTWNQEARYVFSQLGFATDTLPLELKEKELRQRGAEGSEWMVYGYLPVMVSAQCIVRTTKGCTHKKELLYLKDRIGKEFPVKNHCTFCYNCIYNTSPLSLFPQQKEAEKLGVAAVRLSFTIESPQEVKKIVKAFADRWIRHLPVEEPLKDYTRGHFKRGVE